MRFFAFFLLPIIATAAPKAVIKFSTATLQETYRNAKTVTADIKQEVFQASLARTKSSSGNLAIETPNKIHWEITEPEKSLTVSNGKKIWYYTPNSGASGKGQVVEKNSGQIFNQPLFRILTGSADLTNEFTLEKEERIIGIVQGKSVTKLTLKPKKTRSWGDMERVVLTVESNYLISEVLILGSSGNRTKISLQNQQLGTKLSPKLFDFSPPAGAEILKD
jgi:outer membrane lipoprotein carrier protein